MQKLNQSYINTIVRKALEEDLRPRGDITTNLITAKDKIVKAKIIAKQDGVMAGLESVSYTHLRAHETRYDLV